jgi:FkbM family methyltransferase
MTPRETVTQAKRRLRPVFNAIEAALIVIGCAAVAFAVGRSSAGVYVSRAQGDELGQLEEKFGPSRNSEHAEEWIVRDFFQDKRGGVFVDIGANDYRRFSNTFYLETALGWSGIAVEPQAKFEEDYRRYRPRTVFQSLFVSDVSDVEAVLNVPENDLIASTDANFANSGGSKAVPVRVRTSTLDALLDAARITQLDFLTMDIELAEPAALRGFSIERFRPALVCVESHPEVRQEILDYFATHGYTVVGRYLRADTDNLWFTPLSR